MESHGGWPGCLALVTQHDVRKVPPPGGHVASTSFLFVDEHYSVVPLLTLCSPVCQLDAWAVPTAWLGRTAPSFWKAVPALSPSGAVALTEGSMDGKEPEQLLPSQTGHSGRHQPNLQFRLSLEKRVTQGPSPPTLRPDHQGGLSASKVVIPSKRRSNRVGLAAIKTRHSRFLLRETVSGV